MDYVEDEQISVYSPNNAYINKEKWCDAVRSDDVYGWARFSKNTIFSSATQALRECTPEWLYILFKKTTATIATKRPSGKSLQWLPTNPFCIMKRKQK